MVVLADEIFLTMTWPGAKYWERSLLEAHIFQTQIAGELVFKKLDLLLERFDPLHMDLAVIYFFVLTLGFRGQYRGAPNTLKVDFYVEQLYTLISRSSVSSTHRDNRSIMPQCYQYTLTDPPGRGLPDVRTWTLCIVGIFATYVLCTCAAWYVLASDMHMALRQIFAFSSTMVV